jgi:hypothetical protein
MTRRHEPLLEEDANAVLVIDDEDGNWIHAVLTVEVRRELLTSAGIA